MIVVTIILFNLEKHNVTRGTIILRDLCQRREISEWDILSVSYLLVHICSSLVYLSVPRLYEYVSIL